VLVVDSDLDGSGVFVKSVLGAWIKVGRGCQVR